MVCFAPVQLDPALQVTSVGLGCEAPHFQSCSFDTFSEFARWIYFHLIFVRICIYTGLQDGLVL